MRCKYIRKIFQNEENGYTVALFSTLDHEVPLSARDKFWADKKIIAFTAKGYDLPLTDEIEIEMEGEWETNSHGTQYKVETFLEVVPRTREGILGYLSCGSLKGIGPKTAERIVNRFGLDTLEVMEKYPQELLKIQGISQKKLDRIVDSFGKNKVFRELMTFLSPFHVTPKKANMILQKFRDQSVEIIRKQPYILCSVKGFGFLTVDAIARQCCAATNDPMRISGYMSLETAQKAIDIAVHEANKQHDRTLMVYFIGGEPLMAFNLMKDVVDYAKKKCQETNLICKFSTTINGTLVTDEVIDFFVENTFEVKVSLDGPEYVQNLNRRDYAGTGSFEKIMKNLPLLRKYEQETGNQISVASVVTSNNYQYYAESFQFLLDLGIKKLESGIDYYCSWSDEQIQGLREQIEKVFGLYKAHIQKNQEVIFWNLWEQYLKSFLIPCPFYACKAGLTTCYVTTDGGIYTCAELPEFKIGSVEAGLDVPRIREIIYLEDQEDTMCKKCQYIRHCKTRGCQVANYEIHQNVYQPIKVNCEVTKWMYHLIQTNLTEKQLEKLKQEYERRYLRHGK